MDASTSQPWEQQPGESGPAYRAFCAFRNMGPGRSAVKAYGQSTGNTGATQKPGRWNVWTKGCIAFEFSGRGLDRTHAAA